jgi:hypothetical protein
VTEFEGKGKRELINELWADGNLLETQVAADDTHVYL